MGEARQKIDRLVRQLQSVEQRARVAEKNASQVDETVQSAIGFREQQREKSRSKIDLYYKSLEQKNDPEGN
jgi:hypothetical protein